MTFKEKNEGERSSHAHMIKRIRSVLKKDYLVNKRLGHMLTKRNSLIHKQIEEINNPDLYFIKSVYEGIMRFIIQNHKKYNSINKMKLVYDHGFIDINDLKDEKKILTDLIRDSRIVE